MLVVQARARGMCFGVQDALEAARSHPDPARVTIHGELVHNPLVNHELSRLGYRQSPEVQRPIPSTPEVMITAHGVSQRERQRLELAGKAVMDTTCPLVRKAHKTALFLERQGYLVVVVGRPDHVEVQGLVGDLTHWAVIQGPDELDRVPPAERLGVMAQTTTPPDLFQSVVEALRATRRQADIRVMDTICAPTRDRQEAVRELLRRVQALVVVGGHRSNNTRQLARLAQDQGVPCRQVEGPEELDLAWVARFSIVGLTAGTSTPEDTIQAVHRRLLEVARLHPAAS